MLETVSPAAAPCLCEMGCLFSHRKIRQVIQRAKTWREWFICPDGAAVIIWYKLPGNLIRIGKSRMSDLCWLFDEGREW